MNHILKKTIQCLLSIFCVFGIMNTPVNTVKADGGFIYQSNGWSDSNDGYSFSNGWSKASNINEVGTYFFGYSSNENDSLETTALEAISDSDISLINSNNDCKSSAITVYSNYLMLKTDNLSVGEYTLTIKGSSLKVTVEKTYAVLKDTDNNEYEYTLGQNNLINLKMGNKYTLTEVYKQTVSGKKNYTISDVTDNGNHYIDITNENGSYIIEPKEGNAGVNANFKIDTQEFSLWPSYKIKENISSYVGTIQINDDNSFAIRFDDEETLNSIQMNSNLDLIFDDENSYPKSFILRNCVKSDSNLTLEGDSNVFRRGGSNVTEGKYSVYLSQWQQNNGGGEQVNWYLKAVDGNEKVQLTHNINEEVPEGLSYSLTQEEGFKLTCAENEACSAYLDTFYDTCMDSTLPAQTMYSTSVIYGYRIGGGAPFFAPGSPKNQIFEKKLNKAGKTTALTVPFDDFVYGNTNFEVNVKYPVTVHVLGYADYDFRNELIYKQEIPNALPDGATFDVKWDKENQKVIYITNREDVFDDSKLVKFSILTTTTTTGENGLTDQKLKESEHEVTYSNGLYYLTFTNDIVSGLRYSGTASITLVHREYGKVKAEHTITLEDAPELLDLPKDLNVQIIGAGIVITTSDTQYIDKAIGNLKIKLCSQLIASPERYQLDDAKYPLKKINNNQVILYIKEDELKALKNDGVDSSLEFNINSAYYVLLYSEYYQGFNITGSTSLFKQSLEPIILAASKDTVANTSASASELQSTLSKLDETATKLQNVTVDDKETNNTDVSIVGNVAGAITENYKQGNMDSDLNLLPDSDDNKETITVKTNISNLDTEEANELANKVGGEATTAIDVSISKEYTKDPSKNTEITELPYDSVLTFDLPEASEEETYVVVREHEESDGTTSYTLLDVTENEDGIGSVASSKFSKFALVKQTTIEMVESPKSSTTEGSKTNLKFKTSGKANNVYLDNELVDPKNYESKDDGTVTLKEEYVSKLSAGKHTLKIITDKGMASSEFEITAKKTSTTTSKSTKTTNGWDDGGPFTTDTCGNVFDRWGNKIYEAKGCNVGGYNLVRTSVED